MKKTKTSKSKTKTPNSFGIPGTTNVDCCKNIDSLVYDINSLLNHLRSTRAGVLDSSDPALIKFHNAIDKIKEVLNGTAVYKSIKVDNSVIKEELEAIEDQIRYKSPRYPIIYNAITRALRKISGPEFEKLEPRFSESTVKTPPPTQETLRKLYKEFTEEPDKLQGLITFYESIFDVE